MVRKMAERCLSLENECSEIPGHVTALRFMYLLRLGLVQAGLCSPSSICPKSFLQPQGQGLTLPRMLEGCTRGRRWDVQRAQGTSSQHYSSCPLRGDATNCATGRWLVFGIQREGQKRGLLGDKRLLHSGRWQRQE